MKEINTPEQKVPAIIGKLTEGQARYWNKKAKDLTGKVDLLDPAREDLRVLRKKYTKGTRVYRASTGGKWGKSVDIVIL